MVDSCHVGGFLTLMPTEQGLFGVHGCMPAYGKAVQGLGQHKTH